MSQIASTPTSTRRLRRWTITAAALASLLVAASGAAASQDLRSPDARAGVVSQDLRSPDARAGTAVQDLRSPDARAALHGFTQPGPLDLRSPDGREAGQFVSPPQQAEQPSGGFDWAYLAVGGLLSLAIGASVLLVQRRRHRPVPLGS